MALLWIDGFDAYGQNGVSAQTVLSASGYTMVGTSGEPTSPAPLVSNNTCDNIGYSLYPNSWHNGYVGGIIRSFSPAAGIVMGVRVFIETNVFMDLFQIGYNNLLGTITPLLCLYANGEAGLTVTNNNQGVIAASSPNVLFPGVWQYIEVLYTPGPDGALQIKIDGAMVINLTGAAYGTSGLPATVNYISFINGLPSNSLIIDDLYVCDQTGTAFNTFLGDVVVHAVFADADAGTNQFAQVGGSSGHFTSIDEQTPDDDASYLYSNTAGAQELFDLGAFPADIVSVLAVGVSVRARKDTAGYQFYQPCIVVGGVESDGPVIPLSQDYQTTQTFFQVPPGGGAWTTASAESAEIGFKIPT